jgi:hypothetical protein
VGDVIDVNIEGMNSSRNGPATYRGIPVRIGEIPEGTSTGDTLSVKVFRIEPHRLLATGLTDMRLRGELPEVGDSFQAIIAGRTNSGRGLVQSFVGHTINVGRVKPDAVGETIEGVLLNDEWAYCLTDAAVSDGYDDAMATHVRNSAAGSITELRQRRIDTGEGNKVGRIVRGDTPRDSRFRDRIVDAYDGRCAICGQRIQDARSGDYFEIEAAHIYPVSGVEPGDDQEGGPDTIKNGLALCRTHHWALDNGWFAIDDDYTILVADAGSKSGFESLNEYAGKELYLPDDRSRWPAQYYIRAHRENVWSG